MSEPVRSNQLRLGYLALEAPIPGHAPHTHVHEMIRELTALGWKVESYLASRSGASAGRFFVLRLFDYLILQARLICAFAKFDAIYVRAHFMALPAALAARIVGKPVVHEVNGNNRDLVVTYPGLRPLLSVIESLQRWQLRWADRVFAVTPQLAEWARQEAGHARVEVVSNAANTNLFRPDGDRFEFGKPYVVFIGGLVRWHGIDTMIAARNEPDWPENVALLVVGDGIEREKLVTFTDTTGRLVWLGKRPYAEIPEILRGAFAALVPIENPGQRSDTGVMPLKLFEAMACGTPVVATDLAGQRELVLESKAGILVPPGDPQALARAVRAIVEDPASAERMGESGAALVNEKHSWRNRAQAVDDALRKVLGVKV